MNKKTILIGTDPEVFLQNSDGFIKSAIPFIPGSKAKPYFISDEGHAIQTDNILAEFCVPPVKLSESDKMYKNIQHCLNYIDNYVSGKNLKHKISPAEIVSFEELCDPLAKEFGCDPDFNAWTLEMNERPSSDNEQLRTCGGHIHIGYDNSSFDQNVAIIKTLDLFLGVPSILLDTDTLRRELYGKAGAFRVKEYGVEYRVLSNFWIQSQEMINLIFYNILQAIDFINNSESIIKLFTDKQALDIQTCINTCDKKLANKLIKTFNINIELKKCVELQAFQD